MIGEEPLTWTVLASHFIGDCFDLSVPYLDKDFKGLHPTVRHVLAQLYISCHLTNESTLLLIRVNKEWDAEILNRSVMEGCAKFAYITEGNMDSILRKSEEYWFIQPHMQDFSRHLRAKTVMDTEQINTDMYAQSIGDLILEDDEIQEMKDKISKRDRKLLNQKWSFPEIIKYLSASQDVGLSMFKVLEHGYGIGSHLMHKDGAGVGMVWDRALRSPERRQAVTGGHIARLISDACTWSQIKALALRRICNVDIRPVVDLYQKYSPMFEAIEKAQKEFHKVEYDYNEEA